MKKETPQKAKMTGSARLPGSIWDNNGKWNWRVKFPDEDVRRNIPLRMPGSKSAMPSTRNIAIAEAAAWRVWEDHAAKIRFKMEHPKEALTVNELCDLWAVHAKEYYRKPSGDIARTFFEAVSSVRKFRELYGERYLADLKHGDMLAHRNAIIDAGYCRSSVNKIIGTVKRMIAWALDEDMIEALTKAELTQVAPLKKWRSRARESEPVRAAPEEDIEAVIAESVRNFGDMIRVGLLTGMRPAELCMMKWEDIERRDTVWIYRPSEHKNSHRGTPRVVVIGPRAIAILRPHEGEGDYCFSPMVATEERYERMRLERKTKVQPSQICRAKANPMKKPGEHWDTQAYGRAVRERCLELGITPWHPNQLRHNCATKIRRVFGIDAARAVLGHFIGARITDRYSFEAAEDEFIAKAIEPMLALG